MNSLTPTQDIHPGFADRRPARLARARSAHGLTLLEICITLAILGVLLCIAAPGLSDWTARQRLFSLAAQLATDVQLARSESTLRNLPLRLSFYETTTGACYAVHSGSRHQCTCEGAEPIARCEDEVTLLKSVSVPSATGLGVQSNVSSILFDPLHGTSTPAGTVRIDSARVGSIHQVVNVLGRVRTCSPAAPGPAVQGLRPC